MRERVEPFETGRTLGLSCDHIRSR